MCSREPKVYESRCASNKWIKGSQVGSVMPGGVELLVTVVYNPPKNNEKLIEYDSN